MAETTSSPNSLRLSAEYAIRVHRYDQAIRFCERALKKDKDDLDTHQRYAEALEGKLNDGFYDDPQVFNSCVREWLIVSHNEAGEEKGISFHGLAIPLVEHLYGDDERVITARKHLTALTGSVPRAWETDGRFLKRVCRPTTAVKARLAVPDKTKENGQDQHAATLWLK